MFESKPIDFTGERVVPGLVDANLFNEHLARYRFARQFATGSLRVLDAGCGTGYGSAQFSADTTVVGIDIAADAVLHARTKYGRPGVCFLQASCEALPFADRSFDLAVAFEVIEHLSGWREMLREARRVLRPAGRLIVSTPNKTAYSESRGDAGPNPYHVHEFEYEEFRAALLEVFGHVNLWSQNHAEGIAFVPAAPGGGRLDTETHTNPATAHFLLAVCGDEELPPAEAFAFLPQSSNVLRERERHIGLLKGELGQKDSWLRDATAAHAKLKDEHDAVLAELDQRNAWALALNTDLDSARAVIAKLESELKVANDCAASAIAQLESELRVANDSAATAIAKLETELAGARQSAAAAISRLEAELAGLHASYGDKVRELEEEGRERLAWVEDLESQIRRGNAQIKHQEEELRAAEAAHAELAANTASAAKTAAATIADRDGEIEQLGARLKELDESSWATLGRKLGVFPR